MSQEANLIKTNFSAGEVSPSMYGRVDVKRHQNGAAKIQNFIVRPQGPLVRRMGTKYVGTSKVNTATRLIPFQFSSSQTYILEFTNNLIRIWRDQALVGSPLEVVTTYASADLDGISYAQSADVMYLTHPNYPVKILSRVSDTNWTIANAKFEDGPYRATKDDDDNTTLWLTDIVNRATIKSSANDFSSGDVGKYVEFWKDGFLILGKITDYTNATTVTIEPIENVVDTSTIDKQAKITFRDLIATNADQVISNLAIWSSETEYCYIKVDGVWYYMTTHDPNTVTISGVTYDVMKSDSSLKPTMKATTGKLQYLDENRTANLNSSLTGFFDSTRDVGRMFRLVLGERVVWGTLTTYVSGTKFAVKMGVRVPYDPRDGRTYINDASTTEWKIGAWYVGNYPRVVTLHQGRLCFAGSALEPNRVWLSKSDDYVGFGTSNLFKEVTDDSAITIGIASGEINTILWLQSGPVLLIGTIGEEFQVKPTNSGEALTPTNTSVTVQTSYGSAENIRPIKVGAATLFVQAHGQKAREMVYDYQIDGFTASDITIVSEHILRIHNGASYMAYQQPPNSILWFLCADGNLVSLTYEKEQEVYAWTSHMLGGTGVIRSIAAIPSDTLNQDELYMVVDRVIGGVTKKYIEVLSPEFNPSDGLDKTGMTYLDCHKTVTGSGITTITGLSHLEGRTVQVLANNAVHPDRTVASGQITLDYAVDTCTVGFGYESYVKTLPMEGGSQFGTTQGKLRKITRLDIQLLASLGLGYGRTLDDARVPRPFRDSDDPQGASPPLFTGYMQLTDDSGFNADGQFYILQGQPYPLNILSLMPRIKANE